MIEVPFIKNVYDGTFYLSILAVVTTVLQFLSGTLVCKQYIRNKTTAEASALPFLLGVLSCGLWLLYGLTLNDNTIVLVNTIGVVLMTIYTLIFYKYTLKKSSVMKQFLLVIGLLFFTTLYVREEMDYNTVVSRLGFLACSLTILAVASPLNKLFYVMKVKSTECLPFPMILMTFFVSLLWFRYGAYAEDRYLMVSNAIGGALALFQLSLFMVYPRVSASASLSKSIIA